VSRYLIVTIKESHVSLNHSPDKNGRKAQQFEDLFWVCIEEKDRSLSLPQKVQGVKCNTLEQLQGYFWGQELSLAPMLK